MTICTCFLSFVVLCYGYVQGSQPRGLGEGCPGDGSPGPASDHTSWRPHHHEGRINNDCFESWFITMMLISLKGIGILQYWSAVVMCVFAKVQVPLSKI